MDEPDRAAIAAYVRAAAVLHTMPISPEREPLVIDVMARLAEFAADLRTAPLADEDEPASRFEP
jgi:hypothetical protein